MKSFHISSLSSPHLSCQINEELKPGFRKSSSFSSTSRPAPTKSPMLLFPVVLHLITSPYFRSATVTPQLIADLATYLKETTGASPLASQQVRTCHRAEHPRKHNAFGFRLVFIQVEADVHLD